MAHLDYIPPQHLRAPTDNHAGMHDRQSDFACLPKLRVTACGSGNAAASGGCPAVCTTSERISERVALRHFKAVNTRRMHVMHACVVSMPVTERTRGVQTPCASSLHPLGLPRLFCVMFIHLGV